VWAPCRKIYGMLKTLHSMKDIPCRLNSFPSLVLLALLLDYSASRIARELWCKKQEFFPVYIIPPWFSMLIYHQGDNQ
jgi:hypothetical protein